MDVELLRAVKLYIETSERELAACRASAPPQPAEAAPMPAIYRQVCALLGDDQPAEHEGTLP